MKSAISNIALSAHGHADELAQLAGIGFEGLEVALSRVWQKDWNDPGASKVEDYRRTVEAAGLSVVGLHSLFWERPELSLFGDAESVQGTTDFLIRLSSICRDLGGRTLIYGSRTARTRGHLSIEDANAQATDFFGNLCQHVEGHGTCFCIEPLETEAADYVNSVLESLAIVKTVNHPALQVQVDLKAMAAAREITPETFEAIRRNLVHVHANEPGFDVLGSSGAVDHATAGAMLKNINYDGYVSIEQRMINADDPLAGVRKSAQLLKECYS